MSMRKNAAGPKKVMHRHHIRPLLSTREKEVT